MAVAGGQTVLNTLGSIASIIDLGVMIWVLITLTKLQKSMRNIEKEQRNENVFDQMMERSAPISISLSEIMEKLDDINDEDWDEDDDGVVW